MTSELTKRPSSSSIRRPGAGSSSVGIVLCLAVVAACGADERTEELPDSQGLSGGGSMSGGTGSATAGSDDPTGGMADGDTGGDETSGGMSESAGDSAGDGDDDDGDDDDDGNGSDPFAECDPPSSQAIGAGDEGVLAAGLSIVGVEANQAVGIALWNEQGAVDAGARPAPLITDRPMMVRAIWSSDGGAAQEVEGRLIIRNGADEYVFSQTLQVAGEGDWKDNFFSWVVPPCLVTGSTEWAVGLFDPSEAGAGGSARVPAADVASLDPWTDLMELNMVFVVTHPTRGEGGEFCTDGVPDAPAADISSRADDLKAYVMSSLPLHKMEVVVTEPVAVDWGPDCSDPAGSVDYIDSLREQEGRGVNWYYQALVPYYPGYSGSAVLGAKVSWSEWWDYLPIHSVHELIHNLGISHVDSQIDAWGWGPYDGPYPWEGQAGLGELKDPSEVWNIMKTTADTYMWVDTGVYGTTANTIREMNAAGDRVDPKRPGLGAEPGGRHEVQRVDCQLDKSAIRR